MPTEFDDDLDALIARADLDGLVRLIDARCTTRDWEGLLRVRTRSRFALETGRQLWPAATLAEYRLALHAPAEWAAQVIGEDGGRFSIGPLTEVVAQAHSWAQLSNFLPVGPRRAFVAHERVLRGDIIDLNDVGDDARVLDLPLSLAPWEPAYNVPTYSDNGIDAPSPMDGRLETWSIADATESVVMPNDIDDALHSLVEPWTTSSNGRAESLVVEGPPDHALHALGARSSRLAPLSAHDAVRWLAWCGASGGAHGRRRGGALGRFGTWWMIAAIGGLVDDWDDAQRDGSLSDEVGAIAHELTWWRFDDGAGGQYDLSIVAHDPVDDVSFVLHARDNAT